MSHFIIVRYKNLAGRVCVGFLLFYLLFTVFLILFFSSGLGY